MFWRKNKESKKEKTAIDKVLMGAVIGGAIGSVLGASLAPKKGEDTRKEIAEAAKKATHTSVRLFGKIKGLFKKDTKKIPNEEL